MKRQRSTIKNMVGEIDLTLASVCQVERRALMTLDTDFADIRAYPPEHYGGIVVLRLKQQDKVSVLKLVARIIKALTTEELVGFLWIVDEKRIRVRG